MKRSEDFVLFGIEPAEPQKNTGIPLTITSRMHEPAQGIAV